MTECCLRASANVSYENAAQDVERYTGMRVSAKTQQRLVHRHQFQEIACVDRVDEISLDGGKVRLRTTTKGESCIWRDYKAVCIHPQARMAWFQENEAKGRLGQSSTIKSTVNLCGRWSLRDVELDDKI